MYQPVYRSTGPGCQQTTLEQDLIMLAFLTWVFWPFIKATVRFVIRSFVWAFKRITFMDIKEIMNK